MKKVYVIRSVGGYLVRVQMFLGQPLAQFSNNIWQAKVFGTEYSARQFLNHHVNTGCGITDSAKIQEHEEPE